MGGKRTEKQLFCKINGASARPTRLSAGSQMVNPALEQLFSRMLFSVILLYIHSTKTQNFHGRHITSRRKTLTLWQQVINKQTTKNNYETTTNDRAYGLAVRCRLCTRDHPPEHRRHHFAANQCRQQRDYTIEMTCV